MRYLRWCLPALLLGAMVGLGCSPSMGRPKRGARVERLPKLVVVEPSRRQLQRRVETSATVEAMKKVEICARVVGTVRTLDDKMDVGQQVKAGEVMLTLDVPDLEADLSAKKALLKQAEQQKRVAKGNWDVAAKEVEEGRKEDRKFEADVEFSRSRLSRISKLVRDRAQDAAVEEEAKKQYEAARSALEAQRARTAKRESKVEASEAEYDLAVERIKVADADLKRATELVNFATVRAPFDGVIVRRSVDPGATIKDAGTTLFTFMQMDRVRVLIDVPQRDAALLNAREQNPNPDGKGDTVTVTIPALAELPNRGRFEGTVTRLSRALDPVTRTMRAEIELPNPNLDLKPGMYGTASVLVEDRSAVLTVPASALVRRGEGVVEVYVVAATEPANGDDELRGVLQTRAVLLGIDDGKEVEIREGLKGDELVVTRATAVVRPNDLVIALVQREER